MTGILAALAGCNAAGKPGALELTTQSSSGVAVLQTVNDRAQACWMASRDAAFTGYRLIPELDTTAGKPRLLLVAARDAQGLPKLVIETQGNPALIRSYGPLTRSSISARINGDVTRWAKGETDCKA